MAAITDRVKFAIVVNGSVKGFFTFVPNLELEIAGFSSDPKAVEITDLEIKPSVGWTWDGNNFNPPVY